MIKELLANEMVSLAILVVVTVVLTLVAVRFTNSFYKRTLKKFEGNSLSTIISFSKYIVIALIYFAAAVTIIGEIPGFNNSLNTILAGSGVAALAVGIASQEALGSIASGIMILAFKPFVIGDFIKGSSFMGTVEDISLRHTTIKTAENKRIIVPNSTINSETIENAHYSDTVVCTFVEVGITYESDIDKAKAIMAREVRRHPNYYDNRANPADEEVMVRVIELADSSVNLRAWAWAKDNATAIFMKFDLLESIKKAFDDEGVDIAYPHIAVVSKK